MQLLLCSCTLAVCLFAVVYSQTSINGYRLGSDPTYLIIAPNRIYPNEVVQVSVSILRLYHHHLNVRASIRKDGEEHASFFETFTRPSTRLLQMKMLENTQAGNYTLRVEGSINGGLSGNVFENETDIIFDSKQVSLFIQTNKPLYKQGQTVYFRVIPVKPNLMPVHASMDVYVKDPSGSILRRWLSMQTNAGILEMELELSEQVQYGTWTIEVDALSHIYKKQFIVEEFFLPRYFVNVSMPHYIMDDTFALAGLITANHTSGRPVRGDGKVRLEMRPPLGEIDQTVENVFPTIERKINFFEGRTDFMFTLEEMEEVLGRKPRDMELHVTATIEDWYLLQNKTGYAICVIYGRHVTLKMLGDKSRTFKPGFPVNVYYAVQHADGSPLYSTRRQVTIHRIIRTVTGLTRSPDEERYIVRDDGIVHYSFVADADALSISVTAYYDSQSRRTDAPRAVLELYRTFSLSNNFLHIDSSTEKPVVNDYMLFTVRTSTWVERVDYMIVAGGNIILVNFVEMTSLQKTFSIALSRDMVPSARLVAYYIIHGEVVADALNFHINGTIMNEVEVKVNMGKDFSRNTVEISGRTDPGSFIAFSGMDYEMYAKGTNTFITEEDVIEEMETYDSHTNRSFSHTWYYGEENFQKVYFPSPSYGVDANTTFAYAGLVVFTDANVTRMGHMCNETVGLYPCMDGTCFQDMHRCDGVSQCTDHLDEMGCDIDDGESKYTPPLQRYKHTTRHYEEDASWLWRGHFTKPDGQIDLQVNVPKEPMSWVISAVTMSRTKGFGVVKQPTRHQSTRQFYIRVEAPDTAVRGEQIGVRVALFNYWHENLECIVTLHESDQYHFVQVDDYGVVSSYSPKTFRGNVQTMAYVWASHMVTIYMPVLPKVFGDITITVSATSSMGQDQVTVPLHVKFDGVTNFYSTPYLIDLLNYGSLDVPDLDIPVPEIFVYPETSEHLYVPGSGEAFLSIVGDIVGPGFFEPYLNAENLMRMPYGGAEQNMFNFAANLYFLEFMKVANRLDNKIMNTALEKMTIALQRQMSYMNDDGSFNMFRDYQQHTPSTWVTAFVLETLQEANVPDWRHVLYIDVELLNRIAKWLCDQQEEDGSFNDQAPVYDRKMANNTDSRHPRYDTLSLTSYVLIALAKSTGNTGTVRAEVENAKTAALQYIERHLHEVDGPFQSSLVTYALNKADSSYRQQAYNKLMTMKRQERHVYFSSVTIPANPTDVIDTRPYMYPRKIYGLESQAVESSAYALMILLEQGTENEMKNATSIMLWLQSMRNSIGGFSGTRDTVVALQALVEYAKSDTNRYLYNIEVSLEFTAVPNPALHREVINLNRDNWVDMVKIPVPIAYGQVMPRVTGTGMALMQLHTMVNVEFPKQLAPKPEGIYYELEAVPTFSGKNGSVFTMDICTRWLNTSLSQSAGMTVIEADIPTGYVVMNDDLREYVQSGVVPQLRRAEFKNRTMTFYLDYVESAKNVCVKFQADRWFPVANATIQHKLKVYDYYEPGLYTPSLYTTYQIHSQHICLVCGSFQCPYCPYYNTANTLNLQYTVFITLAVISSLAVNWHSIKYFVYH